VNCTRDATPARDPRCPRREPHPRPDARAQPTLPAT
jgi:hypothetical protein